MLASLNPFASIKSGLTTVAFTALATFAGWQTVQIEGLMFIHGYKSIVREQALTIEKDRLAYATAQAEAQRIQNAANQATAASYSALAQESYRVRQTALEAARRAADSYALANRVRVPAIYACREASGTEPATLPLDPGAPGGPGSEPDMVAVAREDFDKLTVSAVQAAERGDFLQSVIDEGFAVIAPEF